MTFTETYTPLEIKTWRHQQREQLIESRIAVGGYERKIWQQEILLKLQDVLKDMEPGIIAFYWPFKGEIDCRTGMASGTARRYETKFSIRIQTVDT
jgi:5-formyltetrahydrofolate cyclo-ligase